MNDIAKLKTTVPADEQGNLFEAYGNAATARSITGTLLRFSKGDFLAGQDNAEVPIGSRFVAIMDTLLIGWVRWWDNAPTEQRMGFVSERYQPERRADLGELDTDAWEVDNDGKPRDPWQFTNYLVLRRVEDGEIFTFATASKGGRGAIGELSKEYGKAMRQKPDQWPEIELGVGSYQHRDRSLGRIKYPVFTPIVDWVPKDNDDTGNAPVTTEKPKSSLPKPTGARTTAAKPAPKTDAAQPRF
jgi:hypothetical protein